jgi:hypothetical protein
MREPTSADEPTAYESVVAITSDVTPPVASYPTEYIVSLHGDPVWQAIWNAIKDWDISRTGAGSYHAPTGDDATHIYEAVRRRCEICGSGMDK